MEMAVEIVFEFLLLKEIHSHKYHLQTHNYHLRNI